MGRTVTKDTRGHNKVHILQMQSKSIGSAETNNILCSCVFEKKALDFNNNAVTDISIQRHLSLLPLVVKLSEYDSFGMGLCAGKGGGGIIINKNKEL